MEYRVRVIKNGASAKNKGLITGRWTNAGEKFIATGEVEIFTIAARDHDEAYAKVSAQFRPGDKRPLAGRSYLPKAALKPRKVGQKVHLLKPYAAIPGLFPGYREGVVTEVVNERIVSVGFEGYHTQYVDFNLSELA